LTSFKSLFLEKFQAYTLDQSHQPLVKLSCESACENLDAISARSAVCLLQPILQLRKKSSWPPFWLRFFVFTHLLMYTVAIGNPERPVRNASQFGSKQQ